MHREVNGYWLAYFPQRKLNGDEGSILENAFSEKIFRFVDDLLVLAFFKTYIVMVSSMTVYLTLDDDDDDADFRYNYKNTMIAEFKEDI